MNHKTPPKPVLTLRVGVTGHRPNKLGPATVERLQPQIAAALGLLQHALAEVMAQHADAFAADAPVLRVVSPVAEGADRLVAAQALALGAELAAPLPFARDFYGLDFVEPTARDEYASLLGRAVTIVELDGRHATDDERNAAYVAVGALMVEQCDVVIALWDGKAATGRGGTGDIVEYARGNGRPVLWFPVLASDTRAGPPPRLLLADRSIVGEAIEALRERVTALLAPPPDRPQRAALPMLLLGRSKRPGSRAGYFTERNPTSTLGDAYNWLRDAMTAGGGGRFRALQTKVPNFADAAHRTAQDYASAANEASRFADPPAGRLALHYAWLDGLATYYSGLYRSAYLSNYFLAAIAVFFAAIGLPIAELIAVVVIIAITSAGAQRAWHTRWIEYRDLAERLRTFRFLRLLAASPAWGEVARHPEASGAERWTDWLYRAIIREAGLPSLAIDQRYTDAMRRAVIANEMDNQIAYHRNNAHRLHHFDHRFHWLGSGTFALTALFCLAHVVAHIPAWITITLPALGAASFSIRNQGEFARTAQRSEHMASALAELRADLAGERPGSLHHAKLAAKAQDAAVIMLSETSDWQIVFMTRPLGLPA